MFGNRWHSWQNPWQMLREMEQEMGRLAGDGARPATASFPPVNIYTDSDGGNVTAELSGIELQDLDISVQGRTLVIRGERKVPEGEKEKRWLRQEREFGRFARNIDLPFAIDPEKVSATYRDGVLNVRLERAETDKPKRIEIKS